MNQQDIERAKKILLDVWNYPEEATRLLTEIKEEDYNTPRDLAEIVADKWQESPEYKEMIAEAKKEAEEYFKNDKEMANEALNKFLDDPYNTDISDCIHEVIEDMGNVQDWENEDYPDHKYDYDSVYSKKASVNSPELIKDALALSSGTMATLTGIREYTKIDKIQSEFVEFIEASEKKFNNWKDAWKEFWNNYEGDDLTVEDAVEIMLGSEVANVLEDTRQANRDTGLGEALPSLSGAKLENWMPDNIYHWDERVEKLAADPDVISKVEKLLKEIKDKDMDDTTSFLANKTEYVVEIYSEASDIVDELIEEIKEKGRNSNEPI